MLLEESTSDELQAAALKAVHSLRSYIANECRLTNETANVLEARLIAFEDRLRLIEDQLVSCETNPSRLARVKAVLRRFLDPDSQSRPVSR
jgi:hypothetical protein